MENKKAKIVLFFLAVAVIFMMAACDRKDFVFPTATAFTVDAEISGEYSYRATITESYAEFKGKYLSFPIRWQDGTLSCDGIKVEVEVSENSLFLLPELFRSLFSGNYENGKIDEKEDRYIFTATVLGKKLTAYINKETGLPTVFLFEEYTLTVKNIELYRDTSDGSYTQNMGDG